MSAVQSCRSGRARIDAPRRKGSTETVTRSRYRICEQQQPHFLTCTVVAWLPVFTQPDTVQVVLDSWRFLQQQKRLTLFGYVVLENHLHCIAAAPDLSK